MRPGSRALLLRWLGLVGGLALIVIGFSLASAFALGLGIALGGVAALVAVALVPARDRAPPGVRAAPDDGAERGRAESDDPSSH